MEELCLDGSVLWRRSGRLRLRRLARADLGALACSTRTSPGTLQIVECWPEREVAQALIRQFPDLQVAVELDQCVVGALLAYWQRCPGAGVVQPWSRRDSSELWRKVPDDFSQAELSRHTDTSKLAVRGAGAVWPGRFSASQCRKILQLGRQLLVQQRGCASTLSVVRAAGWEQWRPRLSAQVYLQQVHARAIDDVRLSSYLDAGYVMRGYWAVGEAIDVAMRWGYRAH